MYVLMYICIYIYIERERERYRYRYRHVALTSRKLNTWAHKGGVRHMTDHAFRYNSSMQSA